MSLPSSILSQRTQISDLTVLNKDLLFCRLASKFSGDYCKVKAILDILE